MSVRFVSKLKKFNLQGKTPKYGKNYIIKFKIAM